MSDLLKLEGVHTHIGQYHILHGVDLVVPRGQLTMLLGRNGAGKTTTLKAVMGLLPIVRGTIRIDGRDAAGVRTFEIARRGVGYVPETRDIFPSLTVRENLRLAARISAPGSATTAW